MSRTTSTANLRRVGLALAIMLGAGASLTLLGPAGSAAAAATTTTPTSATTPTTTLYVSATATTKPTCATATKTHPFTTIAAALSCAASGDEIKVGKGTFAGALSVTENVTISGAGASTIIDAPSVALGTPLVTIGAGADVELTDLTVDGLKNAAGIVAGSGALSLSKVTVENAVSNGQGAGLHVDPSSGTAQVSVLDSTFAGNLALGPAGGAISVNPASNLPTASLEIADTTVSGNEAFGPGGGVYATNTEVSILGSTLAENTATATGGGVDVANTEASLALGDDLIASNTSDDGAADCEAAGGATVFDDGHNLLSQPGQFACDVIVNGVNGDQVGTTATPLNPQLGALAQNGGATETQALLPGSPAIDAGSATICASAPLNGLDQRGDHRDEASRGGCDVGAYDTGKFLRVLAVSATATGNPTCASASSSDPFATVTAALACAASGDEIKVGKGTFSGALSIAQNITIAGAGAGTVIDAPIGSVGLPLVTIANGAVVHLSDLTLNGRQNSAGITSGAGVLTLSKLTVENAYGTGNGGGLYVNPSYGSADVSVFDSTFAEDDTVNDGGAIAVFATQALPPSSLVIADSTLTGNRALATGGGLYASNAQVSILGSTITANAAADTGGGIDVAFNLSSLALGNDIIASNTAAFGVADCTTGGVLAFIDGGNNLLSQPGQGECDGIVNGVNGDQVGTVADPIDPELGPLAANGGATETEALLPGSPAIGTGSAAICSAAPLKGLDQRGRSRNASTRGTCDIGAYDTGGA